jgi:hypothetical protein
MFAMMIKMKNHTAALHHLKRIKLCFYNPT